MMDELLEADAPRLIGGLGRKKRGERGRLLFDELSHTLFDVVEWWSKRFAHRNGHFVRIHFDMRYQGAGLKKIQIVIGNLDDLARQAALLGGFGDVAPSRPWCRPNLR